MNRILLGYARPQGEDWVIDHLRDWWTKEPVPEWEGEHVIPKIPGNEDVHYLAFEEVDAELRPVGLFSGMPNSGFEVVAHLRWMLDPAHQSAEYVKDCIDALSWLPKEHFDRVLRLAYTAP